MQKISKKGIDLCEPFQDERGFFLVQIMKIMKAQSIILNDFFHSLSAISKNLS